AGADADLAQRAGPAFGALLHAQDHLALQLVEPFRSVLDVEVGARVRAADGHDDEVAVVDALVPDRRAQQVAVFLDPGLQIERGGEHGVSCAGGARRQRTSRSCLIRARAASYLGSRSAMRSTSMPRWCTRPSPTPHRQSVV